MPSISRAPANKRISTWVEVDIVGNTLNDFRTKVARCGHGLCESALARTFDSGSDIPAPKPLSFDDGLDAGSVEGADDEYHADSHIEHVFHFIAFNLPQACKPMKHRQHFPGIALKDEVYVGGQNALCIFSSPPPVICAMRARLV